MTALLTLPGMLDPHTHLRDLDWAHKATFATETAAALAGGYWAVFDMPNTPPTTTTPEALALKRARMAQVAHCDWGLYYGASQQENWPTYPAVRGVCGLKIYNNETTGDLLIEDQAQRAQHYAHWSGRIAVHAEGETVREILDLVRRYRRPTHFVHICRAEEIAWLRQAKQDGLPVTVGVTPHHLYLTQADLARLGPFGLMKPELQTQRDVDALWDALKGGYIDCIESDHAPHTQDEKKHATAPYGVPGLETTLPLMGLAVHEGRLTVEQFGELLTRGPQRIFGITPPSETYTRVDLSASYVIQNENLRTAPGWSPFAGMRVYGAVREVWIRGQLVYDGEQVLSPPGFGQNLFAETDA
ncbi:MAG: hypothetical protein ACLFTK_01450 [Anaerolineales bacterium]